MFRTLFLMILLLVGLILGPYLSGHQGYVLIETETKVIQMSIVMLVVFFVMTMAIVYLVEFLLTRFFRLSRGSYNWFSNRRFKRAERQTLAGLMKMTEGDYSKAERLIGKNAKHSAEPVFNFIKAAEAAQQNGDEFAANKYLIEASNIAGANNIALELARTRILLQQGKLHAARSAVDSLLEFSPKNSEALRLAMMIYQQSHAYVALDGILVAIRQSAFLSDEEYIALEHLVEDGLLDEKMNEEGQNGLLDWWESQTSHRRKSLYVRVGLIQRLIDVNDYDSAAKIALETLKKYPDEQLGALLVQLTRLQLEVDSKLFKLLLKREAKATACQSAYQRVLAYLYAREGLFEQAKAFLVLLLDKDECDMNDRIIALHVAEHTEDNVFLERIKALNLKQVNFTLPEKVDVATQNKVENEYSFSDRF